MSISTDWNSEYVHTEKIMILNQKHAYHGFKSICYRISNIFIGSCSIFLWINIVYMLLERNAIDSIAYFSQCSQS